MTVAERNACSGPTSETGLGETGGETNTSQTSIVGALSALVDAVPADAPQLACEQAADEADALGKDTEGARRRTYRYLRELYLDPQGSTRVPERDGRVLIMACASCRAERFATAREMNNVLAAVRNGGR